MLTILKKMSSDAKNVKIPEMFLRGLRKRALKETTEPEVEKSSTSEIRLANELEGIADPSKKIKLGGELSTLDSSKENTPILSLPPTPVPKAILPSDVTYGGKLIATLGEPGWKCALGEEFKKPYMIEVFKFLDGQEKKGVRVFPPRDLIFNAFNLTPFKEVKVVLLGQDPYHNVNQAHGLCFSVQKGVEPPPSLKNIYKELKEDYPDFNIPNHGCLEEWAKQGIFMLNATLTVEAHKANSHSNIGWQKFTDTVIKILSTQRQGIVFLLWGGFAHKKEALIDKKKHGIIKTAHPSPLSARLFTGCKCFSKVNEMLVKFNKEPIKWNCL